MEARAKALQAHRGDSPVAVAPSPTQQIDLLDEALDESRAELAQELRVLARGGRKGGVEMGGFVGHALEVVEES